uniref:Uncharacterized protein n=1 Tax=Lepeophtheirus salmonis TaxID=72036 RepID=A0A0K2V773_LEPSM
MKGFIIFHKTLSMMGRNILIVMKAGTTIVILVVDYLWKVVGVYLVTCYKVTFIYIDTDSHLLTKAS